MKTPILYILFLWVIFGCQSRASEEVTTYTSEDSHIAVSKASTVFWLNKLKTDLLNEYQQQDSYEGKARVVTKYERRLRKQLDGPLNNILDSITVRVDHIDTSIQSIYYIRFRNAMATYTYSVASKDLRRNSKTRRLVSSLQEGADATVNFKVQSLKINDPTGPLSTFEIEAIPLPLK